MPFEPRKPYHAPAFLPAPLNGAKGSVVPIRGFRQGRLYSCGYAVTLMILSHFRLLRKPAEVFEDLGTGRSGTRQSSIIRVLRDAGVRVNPRYDMDFGRIQTAIDRGKLLVGYLHDIEHWVLVYGYSLGPRKIYVADPRPGEGCIHLWERYRKQFCSFSLVCSAPTEIAEEKAPRELPVDGSSDEQQLQLL